MSAERKKGTAWESAIVRALRAAGFAGVERRALNGSTDKGDITGLPDFVIEAKDQNRITLAEWVDEAEREARNAGELYGVVWAHRKGRASAMDGYVVMSGRTFTRLIGDLLGVTR